MLKFLKTSQHIVVFIKNAVLSYQCDESQ